MNCTKCGSELRESDIFCNRCGKRADHEHSRYLKYTGVYNYIMTVSYGIAVLACFICNLAVQQTLSWFYIVLASVALAYCITNIPVIVKKHKLVTSGLCATAMVYVLLYVCNWLANGNWLFSVAYPVATVSLAYAWIILLICCLRNMNWLLKSAFISLVAGIATITINPLCNYLVGEPVYFYDYLSLTYWHPAFIGNKITFICCVCYFMIVLALSGTARTEKA